jgi:O-antigen ligase
MLIKVYRYIALAVFFFLGMLKLPLEYAGMFMLLALLIYGIIRDKKLEWDKTAHLFSLFFLILGGSLLLGLTRAVHHGRFFSEVEKYWGSFVIFLVAYFLMKKHLVRVSQVVKFFIGGLFVTSVLGWLRMIPHLRYLGFADRAARLDTPLGICNNYASILIIGILILAYLIKEKKSLFLPWIDWSLFIFFILSVFFSQSDGAMLGIVVGLIVIVSMSKEGFRPKRFFVLTGVLLALFVLTAFAAKPYFLRRGNAVRLGLWQSYAETAVKYPLTGVGARQMGYFYEDWKRPLPFGYDGEIPAMDAHNFVLQYAAEHGIPALLLMVTFLVYYFSKTSGYRGRWFGIYCGMAAFLIQALFSNNFIMIRQMMYFWFFMGLFLAEMEIYKRK